MEAYRLYAGTQSGMIIFRGVGDIWTSMGGSREFEPYFKNQVVDSVYGCRRNPETVFAGVTFDGLYRTKDAGRHWRRVLEGDIRWVTVDPTDESVIYTGTEPVHLYRSEDGGQSWRQIGAGLPAKHAAMCWQLAFNPYYQNSIFAAFGDVARGHTAGAPGQGAIYVTYDRGDSWEEVALQKRGTKWLQPPAIRVLWAAAEE